jgi:TonB family protein
MRGVSGVLVGRFPILWAILILLPAGLAGCALLGGRRAEPPPPPPPAPPVVVPTPIQMQWEEAPRLLQMVTPIYPDSARRAGIDGQVNLRITVDEQGFVTDAEVVSARPAGLFEEAAVSAILQWVFEPARSGGRPIKVQMGQQINFSLKDVRPLPPPPPTGEKPPIIVREMEPPPIIIREMAPPQIQKPGETPIFMAWENAPILIEALDPVYPDSARQAGLEGMVMLQIVIDEQGKVVDAEVVLAQPPGVFEKAALEAVRKWRFKPALQREKPVKVQMAQTVMFRLNQKPPPPPPPPPGG